MTKLFSMKSLAFAGAAAFALTLAAAPQADAAPAANVDYETGVLTVSGLTLNDAEDGDNSKIVYYQSSTKENGITKATKYSAVTITSDYKIDISNFMGKATWIAISSDNTKLPSEDPSVATTVAIAASPTIKKVTYDVSSSSITISEKTAGDLGDVTKLTGYTAQVKKGTYGAWTDVDASEISSAVKQAKALGTTLIFRIATVSGSTQTSPWSKESKVKISASAKAPKVALDLAATKAFTVKLGNKVEYKIKQTKNSIATDWTEGSKDKVSWTELFTNAKAATTDVTGDAITADTILYVRTKADSKKGASIPTIIELKASVAAPTSGAVKIDITPAEGKSTTSAAIDLGSLQKELQYSTDGTNWKKLTKKTALKAEKKATAITVYVRYPGDKNKNVLPSQNTVINIDLNAGTKTGLSD